MPEPRLDGTLDQHVMLAIYGLQPDAYGVSIRARVAAELEIAYSVAAIYSALDRLEEAGFVKARQGGATARRGGRAKAYFSLTGSGQAALRRSLQGLDALSGHRLGEVLA